MNIAEVIGWKFDYQAGMRCKEIDGILTIIEFPGGIPSQADQATWTAEYNAYITQATLIPAVKKEAQKRIIAIEASWNDTNYVVKQLNALMTSVDFVFDIIQRADGGTVTLTQADKDTAALLQTKKTQIEAIRAASNLIEQDIKDGLVTTESDVINSKRWL